MKDIIKKIFKGSKGVMLEKKKKNSIKEEILMFMEKNPLARQEVRKSWFWRILYLPKLKPAYITISALAIVLTAGGVVSAQAQSALPGDPLYPVKVGLNEKVLQVLAFSEQAKTELSIVLAETRLQEAEKLALKGKITENRQESIGNNFNSHAEKIAGRIEKLNQEKKYDRAAKIASDFEASLKAHGKVLQNIKELNTDKDADSIDSLIDRVDGASRRTFDSAKRTVDQILNMPDTAKSDGEGLAGGRLQAAQNAINGVKKLIEKRKDELGEEAFLQAQNNLKSAEQKIAEGKEKISGDNKDYAGAISLFDRANIIAKESKNLIVAQKNLGIDINFKLNGDDSDKEEVKDKQEDDDSGKKANGQKQRESNER